MTAPPPPPPPTLVTGGRVLRPDRSVELLDVECRDGRIVALHPPGGGHGAAPGGDGRRVVRVDATGMVVAPGLIDLQVNGGFGHDLTTDPASMAVVARGLPRFGVTAFLPTIVTAPADARSRAVGELRRTREELTGATGAATPLGLHLEGPMISPSRAGAHPPEHVASLADDEVDGWSPADVAVVTLAPEVPGAVEVVRRLSARGIVTSLGHTACTAAEFAAARAAGASLVTHLFNAMAPLSAREPGPIGAVLADDAVVAGIICDGVHCDPLLVRLVWRLLGPERLLLVSDGVAAMGSAPGPTGLAGRAVDVDPSGAVRDGRGVLAGSAVPLDAAVRRLRDITGCSPADALHAATAVPARVLGVADRGTVRVGARADLVVLDPDLHLVRTLVGGLEVPEVTPLIC